MELTKEILWSFNLKGDIVPLMGWQNTSVRVENAVLKPVADIEHTEWIYNLLNSIRPQGYRLSKPIISHNGTYVSNQWSCTKFEPGHEIKGKIEDKIQVARLFHTDLAEIEFRTMPKTENPWSQAHRIAWQAVTLPTDMPHPTRELLIELLKGVRLKGNYKKQIVHSDLAGNILFDENLCPLIIDFSPTIAPVEYAEAILVCDCIAWQGSDISEIELLPQTEIYREMIKRAVIFRLAASALLAAEDHKKFLTDYFLFKPIIDYLY